MTAQKDTIISLSHVSKSFGFGDAAGFALKDFSLEVEKGEFIMIMGPSGCGKTTLLNVLGLLDPPSSGTYELNGQNVMSLGAHKQAKIRASKIGFIFQSFNLIPTLTILENVALPLVYSGLSKTKRLIRASDSLKNFHLSEREYYFPTQLSGGQQQRVAIARSLVTEPEIILADEPTGNLDSKSSHIVMEELRDIHQKGNTIIMVTHNPTLTSYATRVINMLDGGIDTDVQLGGKAPKSNHQEPDHQQPESKTTKKKSRKKNSKKRSNNPGKSNSSGRSNSSIKSNKPKKSNKSKKAKETRSATTA